MVEEREREGLATIREVHALLDTAEARLSQQIAEMKSSLDRRFDRHEADHREEKLLRANLQKEATSRKRWAITTALGFGAVFGGIAQFWLERVFK